jgi:hypothetical protein
MNRNPPTRSAQTLNLVLGAGGLLLQAGCPLTGREFREVATPAVHTGVSQILNGLLDGLFAAIEPEAEDASTDS